MRVAQRATTRARRGFSMVEALVAFVLFLTVAAMLTWSMTAAFAARTTAQLRADVADVLTTELDALSAYPPADLLAGSFTVPSPCPETPEGIDGQSCVTVGSATVHIAYRFPDPDAEDAGTCPGPSADPATVAQENGQVALQACVTGMRSEAFAGESVTGAPAGVAPQTRTLPPAATVTGRQVRVHLSGDLTDLGTRTVDLLSAAQGPDPVASAAVGTGTVTIDVPSNACTPVAPCALGSALGGQGAAVGLADRAGAGAPVVVAGPTAVVHVYAAVTR